MTHPEADRRASPAEIESILKMVSEILGGLMAAELVDLIAEKRAEVVFIGMAIEAGVEAELQEKLEEGMRERNERISQAKQSLGGFLNMGFGGDGRVSAATILGDKDLLTRFIEAVRESS